jgi:hypothetical protein
MPPRFDDYVSGDEIDATMLQSAAGPVRVSHTRPKGAATPSEAGPVGEIDGSPAYTVESIVDIDADRLEAKVRWAKPYTEADDSWEPIAYLPYDVGEFIPRHLYPDSSAPPTLQVQLQIKERLGFLLGFEHEKVVAIGFQPPPARSEGADPSVLPTLVQAVNDPKFQQSVTEGERGDRRPAAYSYALPFL